MNIAVFGWYHHQNAGDDRIQACITRWLDGHTLAFLPSGRKPPLELLRTYDAAIIGGGGLIMRRGGMFSGMTKWVRQAGIPVAIAGASIERIDDGLRRELREFFDVCCFAWFRDAGSLQAVGEHPNAFVAPDLTWLYPHRVRENQPEEGIALCLQKRGNLPLAEWKSALAAAGQPIHPFPFYFENGGDAEVLRELLPDHVIASEFDEAPLDRAAYVVTSRFHGLLFGLQAGRPVLTVSSTPKTRRFLAEHGLAEFAIAETEPDRLAGQLRELAAHREHLRARALAIRDKLHAEVTSAADRAKQRLLSAAGEPPSFRRKLARRLGL